MPCACIRYQMSEMHPDDFDAMLVDMSDVARNVRGFPVAYTVRANGSRNLWPTPVRHTTVVIDKTEGYFMRCLRPKDCGGKK